MDRLDVTRVEHVTSFAHDLSPSASLTSCSTVRSSLVPAATASTTLSSGDEGGGKLGDGGAGATEGANGGTGVGGFGGVGDGNGKGGGDGGGGGEVSEESARRPVFPVHLLLMHVHSETCQH